MRCEWLLTAYSGSDIASEDVVSGPATKILDVHLLGTLGLPDTMKLLPFKLLQDAGRVPAPPETRSRTTAKD